MERKEAFPTGKAVYLKMGMGWEEPFLWQVCEFEWSNLIGGKCGYLFEKIRLHSVGSRATGDKTGIL